MEMCLSFRQQLSGWVADGKVASSNPSIATVKPLIKYRLHSCILTQLQVVLDKIVNQMSQSNLIALVSI